MQNALSALTQIKALLGTLKDITTAFYYEAWYSLMPLPSGFAEEILLTVSQTIASQESPHSSRGSAHLPSAVLEMFGGLLIDEPPCVLV